MTFKCVHCRNTSAKNTVITKEFVINGKTLVVENIPIIECTNCHEKFFDKEANEFIDHQIQIFEAEGLENKAKELVKSKGITQEKLGQMLGGISKQRVNQILNSSNIDIKTAYKITKLINEPIEKVFVHRDIIKEEDNKYYIRN
ncbi:helix-turn-helix domain-containing protein [Paenibacillus thermotolerans]|uniref:helix-turn-helix domain-containing protein n=1 Tax=Paenibacillus thermotolerans TaxID=3027807 RepID=UPI002368D5A6|nr:MULTISPECIES: helix-turn-helix domain-containing protein [unclassified Paenibacillus]